jgi:hypothetical protein
MRHDTQILPNGVFADRQKKSYGRIVSWSQATRDWHQQCVPLNAECASPFVIRGRGQKMMTQDTMTSRWRMAWKLAQDNKACPDYFTFHDLKARGITDHPDKVGGHKAASG